MAPLPRALLNILKRSTSSSGSANAIIGLAVSSLELDRRTTAPDTNALAASQNASSSKSGSVITQTTRLVRRAATTSTYVPCSGCKAPEDMNNQFYFALFAIIGVAMVVASLWFFFWAKNGGFKYQEGDWEDYKSTVLRRKGPDGKTLSNATKSTKLGGGSIVHQQARWAAKSVVARDNKGRKGILGKRGFGGSHSVAYRDDFTDFDGDRMDEMSEVATQAPYHDRKPHGHHSKRYNDRDFKHYRHEKVARVGGINRQADGSHFDFSGTDSATERSSDRGTDAKRVRAEKKAKADAADMERQWKREAERAAAEIARENAAPPPPRHSPTKARTPSPTKKPAGAKKSSCTPSPQKRDFSFAKGADDVSTAYTGSSGERTQSASYYDAYRPHATRETQSRARQQSPRKGGHDVMAGYRRGTSDY